MKLVDYVLFKKLGDLKCHYNYGYYIYIGFTYDCQIYMGFRKPLNVAMAFILALYMVTIFMWA